MSDSFCPHPECDAGIPSHMFACRRHWYSLPAELRAKIWRDYRRGDLDAILGNYDVAEHHWTAAP